jgi:diguanylate cyclase (GGDEF)-like protein
VALIWLDGARLDSVVSPRLKESEEIAGAELGAGLKGLGIGQDAQLMIFYDSTRRKSQSTELVMATWLLAAIEKSLGFMPQLSGVGLMGDHRFTPTGQFLGKGIGGQSASILSFGGGIRIDTAIMHGCRPGSGYYTVTKAEGPVILEINHTPAIQFINTLLQGSIKPNEYPFFLLFGINGGERWGEYDEDTYASRLCCGLEPTRGGIVMFEPDMVEGTEFQLMFRSLDLGYMKPKINALFDNLDGREPVFGMYLNCAGRAAGYGGAELEDALVLQQTVDGRVPVLGIYSGVEIAPIMGRPRGLDWTGVFCLFSTEPKGGGSAHSRRPASAVSAPPTSVSGPAPTEQEAIARLCEQNLAKVLELDSMCIRVRHELELKRRGYQLITMLADSLRQTDNYREVFVTVAHRINATLNMHKTAVLFPSGKGAFKIDILQGFDDEEVEKLLGQTVDVPNELLDPQPLVVTSSRPGHFVRFRAMLNLPYFISSPIIFQGEVMAILVTGRLGELPPFSLRLSDSDAETVLAITELLGSVLVRLRLQSAIRMAETDSLTGLYNRVALETIVEAAISGAVEKSGAFIMIDLDHFKPVNDTYGHLVGDRLLRSCADWMNAVLRDTDIIGRIGGDEFAVFCIGLTDPAQAEMKASQILKSWEKVIPEGGKEFITGSIGIAIAPQHGKTYEELYRNADSALYQAKAKGRNCYVMFGQEDASLCQI